MTVSFFFLSFRFIVCENSWTFSRTLLLMISFFGFCDWSETIEKSSWPLKIVIKSCCDLFSSRSTRYFFFWRTVCLAGLCRCVRRARTQQIKLKRSFHFDAFQVLLLSADQLFMFVITEKKTTTQTIVFYQYFSILCVVLFIFVCFLFSFSTLSLSRAHVYNTQKALVSDFVQPSV